MESQRSETEREGGVNQAQSVSWTRPQLGCGKAANLRAQYGRDKCIGPDLIEEPRCLSVPCCVRQSVRPIQQVSKRGGIHTSPISGVVSTTLKDDSAANRVTTRPSLVSEAENAAIVADSSCSAARLPHSEGMMR